MNASRLISWLRRRSWRRENQPAAKRQRIIHAPELLEPRTVLSAMSLYAPDADDGMPGRSIGHDEAPPGLAGSTPAAYVASAENEGRLFDRVILESPIFIGPVLETRTVSVMDTSEQETFSSAKVTINAQIIPLTPEWSLQLVTFAVTPLSYSIRSPWLSNTPSGSPSSGGSSPDTVGSATDDADGEESGVAYGRNYVVGSAPPLPLVPPIIVTGDGWRPSMPPPGAERGNPGNSAASDSHDSMPNYGRTTTSGSLLADELTTHLAHHEEGHSSAGTSSLLATPLAATNTALTDAARRDADDSDDRLPGPSLREELDDLRGDGESEGMIDLDGVGAMRRGRKLAANSAMHTSSVNPRLAPLTDLVFMRDAPSLMRELAQMARDVVLAPDDSPEAGPPEHADDRMLDLLAADVGSLRQSAAAATVINPAALSQLISLEAGVALYQAFDSVSDLPTDGAAQRLASAEGNAVSTSAAAETAVQMREE